MNNLNFKLLLCSILLTSFCSFGQQFAIHGTVEGLADGTWIYLRKASPEKLVDSTTVHHGKFYLKGKMDDKVEQVVLYTSKYADYLSFWMETQPINISLKKGAFKSAVISGSKLQLEQDALQKARIPFTVQEDSLLKIVRAAKDPVENKKVWNEIYETRAAEKNMYMKYVQNNPNSLMSAYILNVYSSSWGKEKTSVLYDSLSLEAKNSRYGNNIRNFINLNKDIKVGEQFVDFEQANVTGKMVRLSDIKAKYILLEFWGSWCGPCRAENPRLVKTYTAYKDKGFEILGVAADDNKEQWLKAIKDDKLPWQNVSDLKGDQNKAVLIYGINAFPTNFLIDQKGKIIAKNLRGASLSKKLSELLP